MDFESIDQIFGQNDRIHEKLKTVIAAVSDSTASTLVDGEKWTIAQLVEHIATVDEGASKVCSKLLSKARDSELPASALHAGAGGDQPGKTGFRRCEGE